MKIELYDKDNRAIIFDGTGADMDRLYVFAETFGLRLKVDFDARTNSETFSIPILLWNNQHDFDKQPERIKAIKRLREVFAYGLTEAKDICEGPERRIPFPEYDTTGYNSALALVGGPPRFTFERAERVAAELRSYGYPNVRVVR